MTSIFVGNLPYDATEQELRAVFERHGRVSSVRIMTEQSTHRSRGFGFVRMPLDAADEAIQRLSGVAMNGRQLTVNESQDRSGNSRDAVQNNSARSSALQMFDQLCSD